MGEELAGWWHLDGCSQWVDVQVQTSNGWCSLEIGTGTCTV